MTQHLSRFSRPSGILNGLRAHALMTLFFGELCLSGNPADVAEIITDLFGGCLTVTVTFLANAKERKVCVQCLGKSVLRGTLQVGVAKPMEFIL